MCPFYNAQLFEITGAAKGVFTHSQSSCHIAKVVLTIRHDSHQIPLAARHHTFPHRGFLHWRFAYAGPGVRRATVTGPASANLHNNGSDRTHSITRSESASRFAGTLGPSDLAVLRLMTNSNLVGACAGRLAGVSSQAKAPGNEGGEIARAGRNGGGAVGDRSQASAEPGAPRNFSGNRENPCADRCAEGEGE